MAERTIKPCVDCKGGGGHFKGDLCIRCRAKADGEQCKKCGSPWVYIHARMSDDKPRVPLCKPCCYAYVRLCGYMEDIPEVIQRMKDLAPKKESGVPDLSQQKTAPPKTATRHQLRNKDQNEMF